MKTQNIFSLGVCTVVLLSQLLGCAATSLPSGDPVRGKVLFSDTTLGTNGKSCNSCHPELGRGSNSLVGKKAYDHTIRDCIQAALQGDPGQEQAVADLKAYLESLK